MSEISYKPCLGSEKADLLIVIRNCKRVSFSDNWEDEFGIPFRKNMEILGQVTDPKVEVKKSKLNKAISNFLKDHRTDAFSFDQMVEKVWEEISK